MLSKKLTLHFAYMNLLNRGNKRALLIDFRQEPILYNPSKALSCCGGLINRNARCQFT